MNTAIESTFNSASSYAPQATYFRALGAGRFQMQRCLACEKYIFYPRVMCPHCGGENLAWEEAVGTGVVYSTTVIRRRSGNESLVLIDLDEGPRLMSTISNCPPEAVRIGMRVRAEIEGEGERARLLFRVENGARA